MADMHVGAIELILIAENWSGKMTVRSAIDGRIANNGAKLYETFDARHLEPVAGEIVGTDGLLLRVRTRQSNLHVAQTARTTAFLNGERLENARRTLAEAGYIGQELDVEMREGSSLSIEKLALLYNSRDRAISEPGIAARKALARAGSFSAALAAHVVAWKQLWRRFDVHLRPAAPGFRLNVPMLLRLNMFHVLQAASLNSVGLDTGVPARGWTGEAYQGHIFWDELFIFPISQFPRS